MLHGYSAPRIAPPQDGGEKNDEEDHATKAVFVDSDALNADALGYQRAND